MRDAFRAIVSGWTLVDDFDALTDRIEAAAKWTTANEPLEPDEAATINYMVQAQIARGIDRGDFEPFVAGGDKRLAQEIATGEPCDICPDCGSAGECRPGCPSRLP